MVTPARPPEYLTTHNGIRHRAVSVSSFESSATGARERAGPRCRLSRWQGDDEHWASAQTRGRAACQRAGHWTVRPKSTPAPMAKTVQSRVEDGDAGAEHGARRQQGGQQVPDGAPGRKVSWGPSPTPLALTRPCSGSPAAATGAARYTKSHGYSLTRAGSTSGPDCTSQTSLPRERATRCSVRPAAALASPQKRTPASHQHAAAHEGHIATIATTITVEPSIMSVPPPLLLNVPPCAGHRHVVAPWKSSTRFGSTDRSGKGSEPKPQNQAQRGSRRCGLASSPAHSCVPRHSERIDANAPHARNGRAAGALTRHRWASSQSSSLATGVMGSAARTGDNGCLTAED